MYPINVIFFIVKFFMRFTAIVWIIQIDSKQSLKYSDCTSFWTGEKPDPFHFNVAHNPTQTWTGHVGPKIYIRPRNS